MPRVGVSYLGLVQNALGRQGEDVLVPQGTTIRELLRVLEGKYGDVFRDSVLGVGSELRSAAAVLVNGRNVGELNGLDTTLGADSDVSIVVVVYPMEGG